MSTAAASLLALAALSSCASRGPLTVSPNMAFWQYRPVRVSAILRVPPGMECAKASWDWGDGCRSEHDADPVDGKCEALLIERHVYYGPGDHLVSVRLHTATTFKTYSAVIRLTE